MRIGLDAFNLAADKRGMGRLVRQTLESLDSFEDVEVVHILRSAQPGAVTPRDLRKLHLDAVWYPWNGMRFDAHAPSIVTINDPFAFTYPHRDPIARWREQRPIRRAIGKADRLFTISQWAAGELQRLFHLNAQRFQVTLPAIEPFWHPSAGETSARPYVLFVAGPDKRKNAAFFFMCYDAAFAADAPELVVAGTLSSEDERRFEAMHAPRRRVKPSDEELRALYSSALAVAVPSLAEGFGLPVTEAMACGAPVIASNATALPEAAGGAALLLDPRDAQAWNEALRRIAGDERLRAELRERGLARIRLLDRGATARALVASVRQLREGVR